MRLARSLHTLKLSIAPYLFYWEEWVNHEDCNLTLLEVGVIRFHLKRKFECNIIDEILHGDQVEKIQVICKKLTIGYQVFKDTVVIEFLASLIRIGQGYNSGFDSFLITPIHLLEIDSDVRQYLKKFKVYSMGLLFVMYRADDFRHGWLYKLLVEFIILKKGKNVSVNVIN